ncbi:MAG: hypothetical protein V1815_00335 [Candidatus Woesearchaeota archaeon]
MQEFFIQLIQYKRRKEKLNRIYTAPTKIDDNLYEIIDSYIKTLNRNNKLEEIAECVEKDILEKNNFVKLNGIKRVLKSYKGIISPRLTYEIRLLKPLF